MATPKNVIIKKTKNESYPQTIAVALNSSISVVAVCSGKNSVDFEFLASGDTGTLQPTNEPNLLVNNSDAVTDTIEFTFYGAATIQVTYIDGVASGGGGSGADIVNRLDYKLAPHCILDLSSPSVGTFNGYPFTLGTMFFEVQGLVGTNYSYPSHTIQDSAALAKYFNQYQKWLVFAPKSDTELYIFSGIADCRNLNELAFSATSPTTNVTYTTFAFNAGDTFTSWGDYLNESLKETNAILRQLSATEGGIHELKTTVQGYDNIKSITFMVLSGTVDVALNDYNGALSTLTYPITNTNGTILGTTFNFSSPNNGIQFLNVTGTYFVQATFY